MVDSPKTNTFELGCIPSVQAGSIDQQGSL